MKTLRIASLLTLLMATAIVSFGQNEVTETIPVSGNCGMCKTAIEKAAKKAGATTASWDMKTKMLTVKYGSSTTNAAKIQEGVAAVGYDTRDFKTTEEAYNKLHACCQYERKATNEAAVNKCSEKCDMKDGKCADSAACKEKGCCKSDEKGDMSCCSKTM